MLKNVKIILLIILSLITMLTIACWAEDNSQDYKLVKGDTIEIGIFGVDEAPIIQIVRPDGKISYPVIGEIKAEGMTPKELGALIANGLKKMYKDPQVTVSVKESVATFSVVGQVKVPGVYQLAGDMFVRDAISRAAGLMANANDKVGTLLRADGTKITLDLAAILSGDSSKDFRVKKGDTIIVDRGFVQVSILGEIKKPGPYDIEGKNSLLDLIASAGGVTERADLSNGYITRNGQNIPINLRELLIDKKIDKNMPLESGDIVQIPVSKLKVGIYGFVAKPGQYEYIPGEADKLKDALTLAGGPVQNANLKRVELKRVVDGKQKKMKLDISKEENNIALEPNDYITVPGKNENSTNLAQISQWLSLIYMIYVIRQYTK